MAEQFHYNTTLEEIEKLVLSNFDYLVNEYGFVYQESKSAGFSHIINFSKNNLTVSIKYARRHDFLDPVIYNENISAGSKDVNLYWIMLLKTEDFSYTKYLDLMPRKIGLEKSFETIALIFKDCADDYLKGNEWHSWNEISRFLYGK